MQIYLWHLFFIFLVKKILSYKEISMNSGNYLMITIFIISVIYFLEKLIRRETSKIVKKL